MKVLCQLKKEYTIEEKMFFLYGVFSTMQIISVFGFTVFSLFTYMLCLYFVLKKKRVSIYDKLIFVYAVLILLTTSCNMFMNLTSKSYQNKAIISLINMLAVIAVYVYGNSKDNVQSFFKGFDLSCKIQLLWCCVQFVSHKVWNLPVNTIVFDKWLSMSEQTTQVRNGEYVCSGLHWHASNMIMILVYLFLFSKSWIIKLLSIFIMLQTSNTTAMLAVSFCIICEIIVFIYKKSKNWIVSINTEKRIIVILMSGIGVIFGNKLVPILMEIYNSYIYRFTSLTGNLQGGEADVGVSSLVHLNYYVNLPDMISNSHIINVLLGYGLSCSGYIYSELYNQYKEMVWVIESDLVNNILNLGIIGFIVFYLLIIRLLYYIKLNKVNYKLCIFILAMLLSGVTYNVQQIWLIVVILMLYVYVKYFATLQVSNDDVY